MKTISNTNNSSNKFSFVIFLVVFMCATFGFAQTNVNQGATVPTETVQNATTVTSNDTDMDFMNWFMGSKQIQITNDSTTSSSKTLMARKKQIMSSGVTPNKVLYRTFVKKVISQDNAIV